MMSLAPRPLRDFESLPYLDQKRRVTHLYPELKRLGLQSHIADLAVQGYTVVPPNLVAPPGHIAALRDAVLRVSETRTGVKPDLVTGATHQGSQHPLGQFMRYVLFEDPVFEPMLTNPVLLGLITYLVGFDALLSLNDAVVKGPGSVPLKLHTDNGDLATPVYADQPQTANINLLLNDYEPGSGTIAFLLGSLWGGHGTVSNENGRYAAVDKDGRVLLDTHTGEVWVFNSDDHTFKRQGAPTHSWF